jgi:nitroimidazol reductase NimA-like FMN-containing flavoprotein (pyridoxamine 5'-phosphate oxidase superfamily)
MKISSSSVWSLPELSQFLSDELIPIRLAVMNGEFPLVCSVWFQWDPTTNSILCASHEKSYLISRLKKNPRIGFEIASDRPPYRGVRGKAIVSLEREGVAEVLNSLIDRYLTDRNDSLAKWLLSRIDEENVLRIEPELITSWDYSNRMTKE